MGVMRSVLSRAADSGPWRRRLPAVLSLALVLAWLALAPRALSLPAATSTQGPASSTKPPVSATLEQCQTSTEQPERAATFAGEMAALPGTAKMEMRVDVLERMPKELTFHSVAAPGLGVWRTAAPGVKTYRYLKEVTNLAAPAYYRAVVRFRWMNAKGHLIKALELKTARCAEPLAPKAEEATSAD
jgi:hypothetical protein